MNKHELVNRICGQSSFTQKEVKEFLHLLETTMADCIVDGELICLQNFGTFSPWQQKTRQGRNPRNGVTCMIPPRLSIKFKPGKRMLKRINPDK